MNVELTQGSFPFTWLTFSKKDRILSLILCRRLRFYCWQNTGTLDLDTFRLLWYHCTSVVFKFVCYDWLFLLLLMVKIMFSLSINEWPECLIYFVFLFCFFVWQVFLTLEPRIFKFHDQSIFRYHNGKKFSKYNREFDVFKDRLFEFDISFYPR